jgi:hypothetical protein
MRALCSTADGKSGSPPLLSTEIVPHCQRQSSKKNTVAGRSSFLTKRAEKLAALYEKRQNQNAETAKKVVEFPEAKVSGK